MRRPQVVACADESERPIMEELIAMFAKVNGKWRFEGFATSVENCREAGKKVEEENGYDSFCSFRIED